MSRCFVDVPLRRNRFQGNVFRDEHGLTTTSMVLSLLITLSLVFVSAQVYRINSASAQVQDVADAAALAAEGQVAEFMLIARYCDAIVLTMSLSAYATTGLGIAALCTPATASLSAGLIDAGKNLIHARNGFADRAVRVLGKLQEALPFYAAACASNVARANNGASSGAQYLGVALLVPSQGEKIEFEPDESSELFDEIDDKADEIRKKAEEAEKAAEEANRSKERAFMRDCGDAPSYCMYERASSLAGMIGADNPHYASVDAWSFSVALARAKAYYRMRLGIEAPQGTSLEEQARSALRARFYRYAVRELDKGYVHESDGSFEANIPHLPSNTSEMRFTTLYTDEVYPITRSESGAFVMHAWAGCPEAAASLERGSISQMEEGGFETCSVCGFSAASMGKVAAASTSVPNGFEYHHEAVADEAAVYESARKRADAPKAEVEREAGNLLNQLVEAMRESAGKRIEPAPPGRYGALAFVVNAGTASAAGSFGNAFVSAHASLGPRAAISAATLVDEGSEEGRSALNSALDALKPQGGSFVGAFGVVLDVWSWMVSAYGDGQQAIVSGVESGLNSLPLVGASGLGDWAKKKLTEAIETVGLQPAQVGALKPVVVNSAHVAAQGEGRLASGLVVVKQQVIAHPLWSGDLFSSLLTDAESKAVRQVESLGDHIEIASIELVDGGGVSIPITIPIPEAVKASGIQAIESLFARIRSYYVETTGVRIWE